MQHLQRWATGTSYLQLGNLALPAAGHGAPAPPAAGHGAPALPAAGPPAAGHGAAALPVPRAALAKPRRHASQGLGALPAARANPPQTPRPHALSFLFFGVFCFLAFFVFWRFWHLGGKREHAGQRGDDRRLGGCRRMAAA